MKLQDFNIGTWKFQIHAVYRCRPFEQHFSAFSGVVGLSFSGFKFFRSGEGSGNSGATRGNNSVFLKHMSKYVGKNVYAQVYGLPPVPNNTGAA